MSGGETAGALPWRFQLVGEGVGVGQPVPNGWQSAASLPLLVIVGVTGVGKSTALAALRRLLPSVVAVPDRRVLTDRCIMPLVWDEGQHGRPPDRLERLDCTRRFRERYAGGMAEVLCRLSVDPQHVGGAVAVFDGLRGADEVAYAITHLPRARFAALTARDVVRLQRLLGRNERFDEVRAPDMSGEISGGAGTVTDQFAALGGPGAAKAFSAAEQAAIMGMIARGTFAAEAVRAKLAIVVAERRNYDPDAACSLLVRLARDRSAVINTEDLPEDGVATAMLDLLGLSGQQSPWTLADDPPPIRPLSAV